MNWEENSMISIAEREGKGRVDYMGGDWIKRIGKREKAIEL